jgi:hypothetical protein
MTSCEEALEAHKKAIIELGERLSEKASVRDQFAMAALHMLSLESHPDFAAKKAYAIADAMMEARK